MHVFTRLLCTQHSTWSVEVENGGQQTLGGDSSVQDVSALKNQPEEPKCSIGLPTTTNRSSIYGKSNGMQFSYLSTENLSVNTLWKQTCLFFCYFKHVFTVICACALNFQNCYCKQAAQHLETNVLQTQLSSQVAFRFFRRSLLILRRSLQICSTALPQMQVQKTFQRSASFSKMRTVLYHCNKDILLPRSSELQATNMVSWFMG